MISCQLERHHLFALKTAVPRIFRGTALFAKTIFFVARHRYLPRMRQRCKSLSLELQRLDAALKHRNIDARLRTIPGHEDMIDFVVLHR